MLHEFLDANRSELAARCRAKSEQRSSRKTAKAELDHGVPDLINQLVQMLRSEGAGNEIAGEPTVLPPSIGKSAAMHGGDLLRHGFTVDQVVHDYGDLCQALTELAHEKHEPISVGEFHTFNRCLDSAIATAVTEFGRLRDRAITDEGGQTVNDHLGVFAHELRARLNTATLAYAAVKGGHVSAAGATGAVVEHSLHASRKLIDRVLAEVRLSTGLQPRLEPTSVSDIVEQVSVAARVEGADRDISFTVAIEPGLSATTDPQMLSAALENVLAKAFKYTRTGGHVSVTARHEGRRVFIEVADRCGGLVAGSMAAMFPKANGDLSRNSLSISRRSIEAIDGTLTVKDVSGTGCVFTIQLPRA